MEHVVSLAARADASDQDLDVLLEVEIEKVVVSSSWDENPEGPIILHATARLMAPVGRMKLDQHWSIAASSGSLDWENLENGDIEGFGLTLTNELEVATERLAAEIIKALWSR